MRGTLLPSVALAAVLAGVPPQTDAASPDTVAAITDRVRVGTQFFVNRTETEESIRRHFQLMKESGFTVARIFVIWDDIERQRGVWTFERYDAVYAAAAANGIKIAATLCAEDPPGWTRLTRFYHNRANLNDPRLREHAAIYVKKVVERYRSHPAHGVWILMNEPTLKVNFEASTMDRFGQWLEAKYGTVAALNKRWFRPIDDFRKVRIAADEWSATWYDYTSLIDWREFNIDNLCDHLSWIAKQVRELDPAHPIHDNLVGLTKNTAAYSWDLWKEAKILDFAGASIHAAFHFNDFKRPEFGMIYAYCVDLVRSVKKDAPFWVTELGGGAVIYSVGASGPPMNPTPSEITRWMWDGIGAGARAIVFWLWHPRSEGREAGEWGLVGLDGRPSDRLTAARNVARALRAHPEVFDAAKPLQASVAIVFNAQTMLMNSVDPGPRLPYNQQHGRESLLSLFGCYRALHRNHTAVDFVDLEEVKSGAANRYRTLYLPYSYAIDSKAIEALRQYVHAGGVLWADGLVAWKDEGGTVRPRVPGGLTDVFGCEVADVVPATEPFSLTAAGEQGGELWRLRLNLTGAEALVRDRNGSPVATRHRYGKGHAYYFGTALSLGYFNRPGPQVQRWILAGIQANTPESPVELVKGSEAISFRPLRTPAGLCAILSNWGPAGYATVAFRDDSTNVVDVLTGKKVPATRIGGRMSATVPLPAESVRILLATGDTAPSPKP